MPFAHAGGGRAAVCCLTALTIFTCSGPASAHVDWTRTNEVDPDLLGLYHLNEGALVPGSVLAVPPEMPAERGLTAATPAGGSGAFISADVPEPMFGSGSLRLGVPQTFDSTETLAGLSGDLTVEFWFKWENTMTSCSASVGLRSGARLLIARDLSHPEADRLGAAGTHGSFRPVPGFTGWPDVGSEEASLGEWRHLALTVTSAGISYDPVLAHDVYSTGTVGRIWLNGHPVGAFPHTFDLSGLQVHDTSRIQIAVQAGTGGMLIDEVALWKKDWSAGGTVPNPFADGRGSGTWNSSCVRDWELFE